MFSSDTKILIASTKKHINFWQLSLYEQKTINVEENNCINCIQIQPKSYILACGDDSNMINLYDLNSERYQISIDRLEGHQGQVQSLAFIEDGSILASGGLDHQIRLWEMRARKQIVCIKDSQGIEQLIFTQDCSILASASDEVKLWDVEAIRKMKLLEGHEGKVHQVTFSPDGQILASCSEQVKLWDAHTGQSVASLNRHTQKVNSISFSPDSQLLASGSDDATIVLWNIYQKESVFVESSNDSPVLAVQFSSQGNLIASGLKNNLICLWEVKNQQLILITYIQGHKNSVDQIVFSPDGLYLASKEQQGLGLFLEFASVLSQAKNGEQVQIEQTQCQEIKFLYNSYSPNNVESIAFSPDGNNLIIGFSESYINVFDIKLWQKDQIDKKEKEEYLNKYFLYEIRIPNTTINHICCTLDGKFLITSNIICGEIQISSVDDKKLIITLDRNLVRALYLAISPNTKVFATCGYDNNIRLWDFESWTEEYKKNTQTTSQPNCFKIIGQSQEMQTKGCKMQETTIESKSGFNLTRLFLQNGADQ